MSRDARLAGLRSRLSVIRRVRPDVQSRIGRLFARSEGERERQSVGVVCAKRGGRARPDHIVRCLIGCLLFVLAVATPAAAAEPVLRVRGQAAIDLAAGWLDGHLIVNGSLRDDTGRPLSGVTLTLVARGPLGNPAELPPGTPCSPLAEADKVPQGTSQERSLRTDRAGRFCVDFEGDAPVDVELRFTDARGLFDPVARRIAVDRNRRGVELRFVDPPSAIDLDEGRVQIEVGMRAEPPVASSAPTLPPLTPRHSLEQTRSLLLEQCQPPGIEFTIEPRTDTPFLGDAAHLTQVLINLLQTAAESIEGPGRVVLRAYEGHGPNGSKGADVVLEIEDTGGGISAEVQERLFDPFFSTKENGTGLGLPIAAKIVDQHKGRMEFESRAGEGATFRVILPVARDKNLHA